MTARRLVVVEGYVDVIAMVSAGYPATVAPLGTALTEDQLTLLWKMADEPMLCFDGDKAGQRAAYRAADLALPRLKPGKSLRFAMLPEGQDPDDLARAGGRDAIDEVLAAARPLGADAVGARDRERHVRHAGAPRRARSAHQRGDRARSATRACANITGRISTTRLRAVLRAAAAQRRRPSTTGRRATRQPQRRAPRPSAAATSAAGGGNRTSGGIGPAAPNPYALVSPADGGEPALSRPPHRDPAPRGADPADGAQSSLAAARPSRGTGLARVPPRRGRAAQERRSSIICAHDGSPDPAALQDRADPAGASPRCWKRSPAPSPPTTSGGPAGCRAGRCSGDLAAACRLASAVAFTT